MFQSIELGFFYAKNFQTWEYLVNKLIIIIIYKDIFCCGGGFDRSVFMRMFWGVFEDINIDGKKTPIPGAA